MITALSVPTWDSALREFLLHVKATKAPKTLHYYEVQLIGLSRWAEANGIGFTDLRKRHLDQYLAFRVEKGVAQWTLHHDAVCAKAFFSWCSKNDILDRSPLAEYQVRKAPRPSKYVPTEEELRRLLTGVMDYWDPKKNPGIRYVAQAKRPFHRDRTFTILLGLMESAARIDELLSLKVDDYQPDELTFTIRKSKGRKPRTIPVSPEWGEALNTWLKIRNRIMRQVPKEADEGWLFISENGGKIGYNAFRRSFIDVRDFVGINKGLTLHGIRHHALHRYAKANPLAAKYVAGHANMNTTMIYVHDDPEFVRSEFQAVGIARGILKNPRYEATKKKRLI